MFSFRHFIRPRAVLACVCVLSAVLAWPLRAAETDAPPTRVIRLNYTDGSVSFAPAGTDDWVSALVNRPLIQGDRLWVEKGGRVELHLGSTAMRLAGATGLEVLDLSDDGLRLKLTQGSFSIRVRDYPDDEDIEVATPNLAFALKQPGEYRFDVDPDRDTTSVSVRQGAGAAYSDDNTWPPVRMGAGQRMRFDGNDLYVRESGSVGPRDTLDRWSAQRDDREDASPSACYVSRDMTGYEDLDEYGDWRQFEGYGAVWVPRVTVSGWAPYHNGHWTWIVPWGWTWVDDAPWGFAPFHYGRWAYFEGSWGWVPGPIVRRPVYAPALVAFVGASGHGGSWGVSLATGLPGVAWFALGPGEPFRPSYTHNTQYLERINHAIPPNRRGDVYINQRAPHGVAVMPERDFVRGAPMRPGNAPQLRDKDLAHMPVRETAPLAPVRESHRGAPDALRVAPPERVFRQAVVGQQASPREHGQREPGERRSERPAGNPGRADAAPPQRLPDARPAESPREPVRQQDSPRQQVEPSGQRPEPRRQQDQRRQQEQGQMDPQRQQQDRQRLEQEPRRQQEQQQQQQQSQQREPRPQREVPQAAPRQRDSGQLRAPEERRGEGEPRGRRDKER